MLAKKGLSAAPSAVALYVEDVFSTYLYSGQSSGTITIDNGIDLSGEGGLVWIKQRNGTSGHQLCDTERGITNRLQTNTTGAQSSEAFLGSVTSTGFTLPANYSDVSGSTGTYASWTFRKTEKFFDVVTYTGDGTSTRNISHNLGSTPGCVIVKRTDTTGYWAVGHRSSDMLALNSTAASAGTTNVAGVTANGFVYMPDATSTTFQVKTGATDATAVNASGGTYVAYLFAHDAGGFGDDGDQSVIKCGSYTGNGSTTGPTVTLDWEPQFVIIKNASTTGSWQIMDSMRGMFVGSNENRLIANSTSAELSNDYISPTATGFTLVSSSSEVNGNGNTMLYIAIRRGPMKTPEVGTDVFSPIAATASSGTARTTSFPVDLQILCQRDKANYIDTWLVDRLRGVSTDTTASGKYFITNDANAETTANAITLEFSNTGFKDANLYSGLSMIWWSFRRAPGFLDIVNVKTNQQASAITSTHNLGAVPEMMIAKKRGLSASTGEWMVYHKGLNGGTTPQNYRLKLNTTGAEATGATIWNNTAPTSTQFTIGTDGDINSGDANDATIVYLFASVSGVSSVGSYTGNGSTQTINCGFTTGARFVLIKRRDNTGSWYVFDTARGIVSGNDPFLLLNSTAAEVTTRDAIDPDNSGFIVNNDATNFPINVNAATYIYLAIA